MDRDRINRIIQSKKQLAKGHDIPATSVKAEEEGGCGVVGVCCSEPIAGKHIYQPCRLMHNRGNGKGGGIAAVGMIPEQLGVSREVLEDYYMLHLAYLDSECRLDVEKKYIEPNYTIEKSSRLDTVDNWKDVPGLEVKPPDVYRYFVRVKDKVLDTFISENKLKQLDRRDAEDEFVNQNSFKINDEFYVSLGEQKAFVMSLGRNIMILKVVGYAEAITEYYKISDLCAHIWIGHQRFPTRGRVWHPGGAHPFGAMDMALVHNGDFANYHSVSEYLMQRNIYSQFVTDTEVSALLFDLYTRVYRYPLEYIIEALAPTTELDFDRLDEEKQKIYRAIQATHIHGSPDGPWFFIIARNLYQKRHLQLLGITDTAMLRPQVFAFADGEVQVALISSEKQAIDATLKSLSNHDKRICPVADRYWNARGGSYSDGGAFIYDLTPDNQGNYRIQCLDKFGTPVQLPEKKEACDFTVDKYQSEVSGEIEKQIIDYAENDDSNKLCRYFINNIPSWNFDDIRVACSEVRKLVGINIKYTAMAINTLTLLNDRHYSTGEKKRSNLLHIIRTELDLLFRSIQDFNAPAGNKGCYRRIDFITRNKLREPGSNETTLVIDADLFPPDGVECDATCLVSAYKKGWRQFIVFDCSGQRYVGCGLGPETGGVTIDVYGSCGDYLGSGIDGLTIHVHGNAQDQVGQITKNGKLVIHGDVGQTFLYGAKGAAIYVAGNAAGRPLINSVGRPRVVINGTCLDFLGESFMAGFVHKGGGFVVLNGIKFNEDGNTEPLQEPYPGSSIFSLASGGAAFIRDPKKQLVNQQLNGTVFSPFTEKDWDLILPYLEENERLFGVKINDLLTVDGTIQDPSKVYRKIIPKSADTSNKEKGKISVKEAIVIKEFEKQAEMSEVK